MRSLGRALVLGVILVVCSAHIGSPDAWFDGLAGPYKVLVHVQAPPVVPGIANVNVRVTEPGITRVTAFVNKFDATGGTPPPDVAKADPTDPTWYRTKLWVMSPGSNSVTVAVTGAQGEGSVVVPLVAHAGRRLEFNRALAIPLIGVGLVLALGLLTIVGALVREGVLPPGTEPDAKRRRSARFAIARTVLVMSLVVTAAGAWWKVEDADFVRRMYRPMPVRTSVDSTGRLVLTITDSAWVHRNDVAWLRARRIAERSELIDDHGKLVHLFMISADGQSAFAHLHPSTVDSVTFTSPLPNVPAGTYSVFADIVQASGLTQTLTSTVTVPPTHQTNANSVDVDDSWAVGRSASSPSEPTRSVLDDGTVLTWTPNTAPLTAGEEAGLRFSATPPPGDTASLEPFLGMAGHAVVVRDDGQVFIHLHPLGTISLAAQARLAHSAEGGGRNEEGGRSTMDHAMGTPPTDGDSLYFPYAFPQPGNYTVWVQVKRHGKVMTGSFPATVGSGASN